MVERNVLDQLQRQSAVTSKNAQVSKTFLEQILQKDLNIKHLFHQYYYFSHMKFQLIALGVSGLMDHVLLHAEKELKKIPDKCFQKCLEEKLAKEKLQKLLSVHLIHAQVKSIKSIYCCDLLV